MHKDSRILIVDDEPINRIILSTLLTTEGYEVAEDESPVSGLQLLKSNPSHYDIVFLDYMMPQMDGIEMLKNIRADERLTDVKVIMQSAYATEIAGEATTLGANGCVQKPYFRNEVVALLSKIDAPSVEESIH